MSDDLYAQNPMPQQPAAFAQNPFVERLLDPKNRKKVIGSAAIGIGLLLLLAGEAPVKIVGFTLVVVAWLACFRVAPSETATFRIQTRLEREEVAGLANEVAETLKGPLSSVALQSASLGQLDLLVKGTTWRPLEFHASMATAPDGSVLVSTELDSWTRNRSTVYFIPVPFSKTIDGFTLYKRFGDRWIEAIQRYDPAATGEYLRKPG